jgi:hypothetical protein
MTYLQNRLIEDTDFNTFRNTLNPIWGTGSNNSGYGQTEISAVANNDVVTAVGYWKSLTTTISTIANHTGSFIAAMTPAPDTNGKITYLANISTNLVTINNNRLNAASQGSTSATTVTSASTWNDKMIMTFTVTFESNNAARYFFNAGGQIGLSFSHPSSSGVNGVIQDICNETGTIWLSSPTSGSVSLAGVNYNGVTKTGGVSSVRQTINTNYGFYALVNSNVQIFKQTGNEPSPEYEYFSSFLQITASTNNAGVVTFICTFDEVPNGATIALGTTGTVTIRPPSTTYITNPTWGTPIVAGTVSYSSVTTSTYFNPGAYAYVVPAGATAVIVSWMTPTGTNSSTVSVTAGQTITVTIGNFAQGSTFGSLVSAPAFNTPVLQFSGNIDADLNIVQEVAGSVAATYTGSGQSGTLSAGAGAAGIYYAETTETRHGDLSASVVLNKYSQSVLTSLTNFRVIFTSFIGRGGYAIGTQPTSANNYRMSAYAFDGQGGEGYYAYTVSLQQIVGMTITTVN